MTPADIDVLTRGWNAAHAASGGPGADAPSDAEYEALVARFG
ncbi:hypothetical protein [Gemmobacter nectariphilus]|nr:hypothetical protein [Gemmobacter nectariphilus]